MSERNRTNFRAGDLVFVRTAKEILSTLDKNGTLDLLPFMPEMVEHCGRQFRVARRIEKVCVENVDYKMQRFPANDVVCLEMRRCDGAGHDGCGRGCILLWKEAWLRHAEDDEPAVHTTNEDRANLLARLKTKTDPTHYFCQSTQLADATKPFPWKYKPWMLWVAAREIRAGNRTTPEVVKLVGKWSKRKLRSQIFGYPYFNGDLKKTPTDSLHLQPGEWVRIKSKQEILDTLDTKGKNRGLRISHAMAQDCGKRFQVASRVEKMISEVTGEMREVKNTVALRGLKCHCYFQLGSCPRAELLYWREIWLRRDSSDQSANESS